MEQRVKVYSISPDGMAKVLRIRESACSGDCHKCSGCGAVQEAILFEAHNPIGAKPGDLVTLRGETGPVLAGAAVVYLFPLLLFFAGYLLGQQLWQKGAWGGCLAFAAGILFAVLYDRKVAGKQKMTYTITGFSNTPGVGDPDKRG